MATDDERIAAAVRGSGGEAVLISIPDSRKADPRIRVVSIEGQSGIAADTPEDLGRGRALLAPEKGRVA